MKDDDLNCITIEGTVLYEPVYSEKDVSIEVELKRYLSNGEPETTVVDVLISPKIAISKNRKVRVFGRLAISDNGILIIISEHLEVRPQSVNQNLLFKEEEK